MRPWDLLAGVAGVVLFVSLFLPWYETHARGVIQTSKGTYSAATVGSLTGWQALTAIDIVLALTALLAISIPVLAATQATPAVPQTVSAFASGLAIPAAILALVRLLDTPADGLTRDAGVWVAAAAALAMLAFAWRSMSDKRFPTAPQLDIEVVPTPTADGERHDVHA